MKKKKGRPRSNASVRTKVDPLKTKVDPLQPKVSPPKRKIDPQANRTASASIKPAPYRPVYLYIAILLVAVISSYANSLMNGFVFDDYDLLVNNRLIRGLANIPTILSWSYRPIRDLSYIGDFIIWGNNPFGYHLTNVLIHAANTLLVFILARRITGGWLTGLFAGLVFAVHPIQTDAVAYVSGRRDVLFTLFYLGAFYSYLVYRSGGRKVYFPLFLALWALGLFTKEMAASLPLVIFVWNFCQAWGNEDAGFGARLWSSAKEAFRRDWVLYCLLILGTAAYAAHMLIGRRASTRVSSAGFDYWGRSFYSNVLTVIRVHAWYLKQLIYPTPIVQYFGAFEISRTIAELRAIASIIVVAGTVASGFIMLGRDKIMAFAVFAYFAQLLPVSQIIPHHELLADHYLYLPMVSFALLVARIVQRVAERGELAQRISYSLLAAVVIASGIATALENRKWRDDFSLWQANFEEVPESPRAAYNLAGQYLNRNIRRAEELYKRALELDASYAPTYTSLARIYLGENRTQEAEKLIEAGLLLGDEELKTMILQRSPARFRSELLTVLAATKGKQGDNHLAAKLLEEAVTLFPNMEAYSLLASLAGTKDRGQEIEVLKRAFRAHPPRSYEILHRLTHLLIEDRKFEDARPFVEYMLRLAPAEFYPNFQMGSIETSGGGCSAASTYLTAAGAAASSGEERSAVQTALRTLERHCGRK